MVIEFADGTVSVFFGKYFCNRDSNGKTIFIHKMYNIHVCIFEYNKSGKQFENINEN